MMGRMMTDRSDSETYKTTNANRDEVEEDNSNSSSNSNSSRRISSKWEDTFSSIEDEKSNDDDNSWESLSRNSSESSESSGDDSSSSGDSFDDSSDDDDDESRNSSNEEDIESNDDNRNSHYLFKSGIRFRRQMKEGNGAIIQTSNSISPTHTQSSSNSSSLRTRSSSQRKSKSTRRRKNIPSILSLYMKGIKIILPTKKSTFVLLCSILIWFYVQFTIAYYNANQYLSSEENGGSGNGSFLLDANEDILAQRERQIQKQRQKSAFQALGQAAAPLFKNKKKKHHSAGANNSKEKRASSDRLPKGCISYSWQTFSFPNCNDIHEIDLGVALHMSKRGRVIPANLGGEEQFRTSKGKEDSNKAKARQMGYLGSGLWRQVWKVNPRISGEDTVLKIMKSEHSIDQRNFDRHRRDSLVMERLTSSPNVVSIYGFCGNTVLTEHGGMTLDEYLYSDDENENENVNLTENRFGKYDRNTPQGKVELALEVMKGVKALHDIEDGPIIHADIQSKQFLLDPMEGVKINDFNRCRILPKNNSTGEICKLRIPSAPGGNRSPEEYELMKINEKIDIFSTAHVLYGILTGQRPFNNMIRKDMKRNVMKGEKPEISKEFRKPSTVDAALADIVDNAYSFDPEERWSAATIIEKLESLKKSSLRSRRHLLNKSK